MKVESRSLKYAFFLILTAPLLVAAQNISQGSSTLGDINSSEAKNRKTTTDLKSSAEDELIRKFEIGLHYTIMFQDDFEPTDVVLKNAGIRDLVFIDRRYESGFGGRFTYNFTRNFALESEANFIPGLPTAHELTKAGIRRTGPFSGGKKTQVLAGVKYGLRWKNYGIFGKIRPGLIRFNAFPVIIDEFIVPSPTGGPPKDILLISTEKPATFFNVDVGGVFEYYPSKRTIIRFDVGDTIIRYNAQEPKDINPSFTRHNLQINVGFGFRF